MMDNLVWANSYISGYAMIRKALLYAARTCFILDCICSTIGKNILARIKCFLLQKNTDRMCLEAYLLRSMVISLVS